MSLAGFLKCTYLLPKVHLAVKLNCERDQKLFGKSLPWPGRRKEESDGDVDLPRGLNRNLRRRDASHTRRRYTGREFLVGDFGGIG